MVLTIPLDSFHTAHLDAAAGIGLMVFPSAETDVWIGRESVHGAAWAEVAARLASLGWQPSRDAEGLLRPVGRTDGGRLVVEAQAVPRLGTVDRDGWAALCDAAGLVPEGRPTGA